ncbi:putative Galactose oxidase, central domain containing protein [Leishmania naiffi]|uniref:Galactose oxidase, central domain containing protein n=1 Tax=Leishmania naiffi TaxID=5678 RepID=A0AAW3BPF8_9TRYP
MDDTSFLSGLSNINEGIGETTYGRCISIFVISCEPSLDELAVRFGGPGCPWETVQLPMQQPVVLYRHSDARVVRRATELALATKAYAESPEADADDEHPSRDMVAMDVLTSTTISAAGSTLATCTVFAVSASGLVTELTAATEVLDGACDAEVAHEALQPPLHVCIHWVIGEILPGYTPPAVDEIKTGESDDAEDEGTAHVWEDEKGESEGSRGGGAPAPLTPTALENVATIPLSPGELLALASPPQPAFAEVSVAVVEKRDGETTTPGEVPAHSTPTHDSNNGNDACPRNNHGTVTVGNEEGHWTSNDVTTNNEGSSAVTPPAETAAATVHDEEASDELGGDVEKAAAGVSARSNLPILLGPSSAHDDVAAPTVTWTTDRDDDDSGALALGKDGQPVASAAFPALSSPLHCKTPRRQRPRNYRSSTVQMEMFPEMARSSQGGGERDATTENSVQISEDDDDDDAENVAPAMTHISPLLPLPPAEETVQSHVGYSAPQEVAPALDSDVMTHVEVSNEAATSYNNVLTPLSSNAVTDGALGHQRQAPQTLEAHHGTTVDLKAPASPRPTVENLFEGANSTALIVIVGVVAIYNASDATDPHRIVSVELTTASVDKRNMPDPSAPHTSSFSFCTTPALRGLAAAVPQVSRPVLLFSRRQNDANSTADDDATDVAGAAADVPPALHATCTLTEQVTSTEEGAPSDCTWTTLWTSAADVASGHGLPSLPAFSPASTSPINLEVRFTGDNGDVVLTQWTYMTVSAYRDAVLNLRSCVPGKVAQPVLQMLLIGEPRPKARKQKMLSRRDPLMATVWVSSTSSSDSTRAGGVAHRAVAVSTAYDIVQQPVSVPLRGPLVYVAVQPSSSSSVWHAQPIFSRIFSSVWTPLTPSLRDGDLCADSSSSHAAVLYYRVVDASTAAATAELSWLPASPSEEPGVFHKSSETEELREVTITVQPSTTFIPALPPSTDRHTSTGISTVAGEPNMAFPSASAWNLVLCHSMTRTVLAEASLATGVLTYRCFLPVLRDRRSASGKCGSWGTASIINPGASSASEAAYLPWEVLLVPTAGLPKRDCGASTPSKLGAGAMRPNTRSAAPTTPSSRDGSLASQKAASVADPNAWSGPMWVSSSALYAAPSTGMQWETSICVSSPPASLTVAAPTLCSPPAALSSQFKVTCAIRSHTLGTDSAVFCLRSLRLVPSSVPCGVQAPPTGASLLSPSQVQLWFTTSGSSSEEVRAAWGTADVPSVKVVQHAWAPTAPASRSYCTPALHVDAEGQLESTGLPVLLSTTNARARLCVALTTSAEITTASDGAADTEALRRCVAMVRKRAIHCYKKNHTSFNTEQGSHESENQQRAKPQLTEEQMAEVFVQCVNAVSMSVDNYAEVDLSPSLVAASERPGKTRHRLLLSSVSGTIRMSHHMVLELQGQWIKMPSRVTVVSEDYMPSPRMWALRRSCVVRHPDLPPRAVCSRMGVSEEIPLTQKVLEAYMGYDVVVQSVPLDYTDPSEYAVQTRLPGLLYDEFVVQMKQQEEWLRPYCETVRIESSGPVTASLRRGGRVAATAEGAVNDNNDTAFKETADLFDNIFGPTGLAHASYVSGSSRKVAVVHFFFGDAYTTRTVLNVSCTTSAAARSKIANVPTQAYDNGYNPLPLSPGGSVPSMKKVTAGSTASSSSSVQVLCDSLTRTSTLYSVLPASIAMLQFPDESHHRYPSELTWYHGSLSIESEEEQRRREEGETAWRRGLAEERLGPHQKPSSLVVSAITQHPYDCLPLVVEPSLTRSADGRYYIVFGGLSTTAGTALSSVYVFDDTVQTWQRLRPRLSSCDMVSLSTPAAAPTPRYGHTAVYRPADGAIYVFGGRGHCDGAAVLVYGDVWRMSWDAGAGTVAATELHCTWADAPSAAAGDSENHISFSMLTGDFGGRLARWRHAAVLHDDYIVVLGGQSSTGACCSCAEVLYLDLTTQEWTARRSFGTEVPCPRYGLTATVASGGAALYIFGGRGHEQSKAGPLNSVAHSGNPTRSDVNGDAADRDEEQSVVALSDFFKMDLITRMWSRVEPNGTVRPPALELADMTSCILDGCPVILLVGGRTNDAVTATPTAEPAGAAQLMVFLFSTATLFWRIVRMDCTPVAARFGLRVVASAVSAEAWRLGRKTRNAQRADSSCVRRALPSRGQHIGSILVVGGLPLEEADVAQTPPVISVLLAAGSGSAAASRCVASVARGMGESLSSQQRPLTPWPPTVSRATAMRRPMTGQTRTASRKPHPQPPGHHRVSATAPGWPNTFPSMRAGGDGSYEYYGAAGSLALPTTPPVAFCQLSQHSPGPASVSGRATTAPTPLGPHHPSCYSTLTPWQQRRLVRRLYTQGIEKRAVLRQQMQAKVDKERTTPAFRANKSCRRSPGVRRSLIQAGQLSAPLHRPPNGTTAAVSEASMLPAAQNTIAANVGDCTNVSLSHRNLPNAFHVRVRRSGSTSCSSSLTTSSSIRSSASSCSDSEWDAEVVELPPENASSTDLSGKGDKSDSECAKNVEEEEAGAEASEVESVASEPDDALTGTAAILHDNSAKAAEKEAVVAENESEASKSWEEKDDHFENASSENSSAVLQSRNAVVTSTGAPVLIPMPGYVPTADMENEEEKVEGEEDDASVATSSEAFAGPVASSPSHTDEVSPDAEVEEEKSREVEQQAPEEPATLPLAPLVANGSAVAGNEAAATPISLETREEEDEVNSMEKDDDYADADWENISKAEESDDHEDGVKSESSAESRSAIREVVEGSQEVLTPLLAPRERATLLLSPLPQEACYMSEPTDHEMSSDRATESVDDAKVAAVPVEELSEVPTTSSLSSPTEAAALPSSNPDSYAHGSDVAEKPFGVFPEEADFPNIADEGDGMSSRASSLTDVLAVVVPAVEAPAAPVSSLQSSHAGDEQDNSEVSSSPAVGTPRLAGVEEDDKANAVLEESQQNPDAVVVQLPATPPTPSSTSFAVPDPAAASPMPASFSYNRGDSIQGAEAEAFHTTATPPQEVVELPRVEPADIGDGDASDEVETPIDESEAATPPLVAEQPEEKARPSDVSGGEDVVAANTAQPSDQQRITPPPSILSEALEGLAGAPSLLALSVANEHVDDAGEATTSPLAHEEPEQIVKEDASALELEGLSWGDQADGPAVEAVSAEDRSDAEHEEEDAEELPGQGSKAEVEGSQYTEKLQDDSDLSGLSGVQDGAVKSGVAAADVDKEAFKQSSAAMMQSRHGGMSMGEEQIDAQVTASAAVSSVHNDGDSELSTPAASQGEEREYGDWEGLNEDSGPAATFSNVEDAVVAKQSVSAFPMLTHEETPDSWSELSPAEEDAPLQENQFAPGSGESSKYEKDDVVLLSDEVNAWELSTPAAAASTYSKEETPATQANASLPPQVAAEDAYEEPDTQASSEEEVEGTTVELNDGRDLLDRRRGVVETLQEDDFDF